VRVLVTGADGFVGRWACAALLDAGHEVIGAVRAVPGGPGAPPGWEGRLARVHWITLELADRPTLDAALHAEPDAVLHLAAVASGAEARANPIAAWATNCLGTCELVYAVERARRPCRFVLASTGEVYGRTASRPSLETDPVAPCSPYAASKAAAEDAVAEVGRRTGLEVLIARPFAQTGPEQRSSFVAPALAGRILEVARRREREIAVGNLDPVREFLDVRDVATALRLLLERGEAGTTYNVAAGRGIRLAELVERLSRIIGWPVVPRSDPALHRAADIPYLVGDGGRLAGLGWRPAFELDQTLAALVASLRGEQVVGAAAGRAEG
jgi:GDP-4-dehydro-6-deoxy-D-mannose reductase